MFIFKLRVVGGPLLWEALGHGLLGLGLKGALFLYEDAACTVKVLP